AMCDGADDLPIKLPKLANVKLETILNLVCEQVNAKFLIYPDHIKIVPVAMWLYETGVHRADATQPGDSDQTEFLPMMEGLKAKPLIKRAVVTLAFKGATVAEVLDEIAATSGANVVLAAGVVGEKANQKLTVRFANTPVDVAVRTVCEMSELAAIEDGNVLV